MPCGPKSNRDSLLPSGFLLLFCLNFGVLLLYLFYSIIRKLYLSLPKKKKVEINQNTKIEGFYVGFKNLGLRLMNGQEILSGITGEIKPGGLTAG
jgi:hypothetical protein